MVNRPPPGAGGGPRNDESEEAAPQDPGGAARPRSLQWSLRHLHKIDTSAQHFLDNYYPEEDEEARAGPGGTGDEVVPIDQTAYEIFKAPDREREGGRPKDKLWRSHEAPLRTGVVDGKKVVFELRTDVTQAPATPRRERVGTRHKVINA